jgi:hypothetical protein
MRTWFAVANNRKQRRFCGVSRRTTASMELKLSVNATSGALDPAEIERGGERLWRFGDFPGELF